MTQANLQLNTTAPLNPDRARAKRLALKCESIATSGRGCSVILAGRLGSQAPMTQQALEVAISMARAIANDADLQHATAMTFVSYAESRAAVGLGPPQQEQALGPQTWYDRRDVNGEFYDQDSYSRARACFRRGHVCHGTACALIRN
jgi:hypothetical protein